MQAQQIEAEESIRAGRVETQDNGEFEHRHGETLILCQAVGQELIQEACKPWRGAGVGGVRYAQGRTGTLLPHAAMSEHDGGE
ncbi:hypothetical protein FH972_021863 [Carpinus fangiana]|uniref:Uncharacterized protein n=1 Tax=Carpinus fangiana TaxID=176857 RepID=A0A5N6KR41_9ROSI|nr:hypothetical protein FH972_021863 [Carpinus fangiana]